MRLNKYVKQIFRGKTDKSCGNVQGHAKTSDFSNFIPTAQPTRKELLIAKCEKHDVSIYIDDPLEQSAGAYKIFRGVASETELEHRLNVKKAIDNSIRAIIISFFCFLGSVISFIKLFR